MSESNGDSGGSGVHHGPGSFAQNNAESLPGQTPDSSREAQSPDHAPDMRAAYQNNRDPLAKAQEADLQKSEAQRRNELMQPEPTRRGFKMARQSHAPRENLSMETDLPYARAVDRQTHQNLQRKEALEASKDQPRKDTIQSKEDFMRERFARAHGPTKNRGKDQSR